jgi:hypothetical protein
MFQINGGGARSLYERNVHPRVLIGPRELAAMQRRVHTSRGKKIMNGLRARLRPQVREILDAGDDSKALAVLQSGYFGQTVFWNLDEIAMMGRIDDDAEAIKAARRMLTAIARANTDASGNTYHVPHTYDVLHDFLSEADRKLVGNWLVHRGVQRLLTSIRRFYLGAGSNMNVCTLISALLSLLAVRGDEGIPDLNREQDQLLLMLEAALHATHGPDGYPVEDIGYGTSLTAYLAFAVEAVRRAGLYDAYVQCPRFTRFGQAILHFVQPWGTHLTMTGDNHDAFFQRHLILARLASVTRDNTLLWLLGEVGMENDRWFSEIEVSKNFLLPCSWVTLALLGDLKDPIHPAMARTPTQFRDRGRGIVSFRSGWDRDATYVVFDGSQRSPSCQGHDHDSCGHFGISALGEYFAIDTGRYNVEQDQHNVVLVDGKSGRSTDGHWQASKHDGLLIDYEPGEFCDFAAVDSSHQHNCYWARRYLGLVKGAGAPAYVWTVEDINKANDWAEFWWTLNTCPGNRLELHGSQATVEGRAQGNMLDVHFTLPHPKAYPKPHALSLTQDVVRVGSPKYISEKLLRDGLAQFRGREHEMIHSRLWKRPRLIAKVKGYNGRFMSLMIPRRKGEKPAKVQRLVSLDNSLAVRISFRDVEDTLIWAYEHNLLEAGDVKARGQWCVIRRSRAGQKLRNSAIGCFLTLPPP